MKTEIEELGKQKGKIAAEEFFEAFKTQFLADIKEKLSGFNDNIQKIVEGFSK